MIEWLKIVSFSVVAAVAYGILHDLVTAHLALEYFTIAHPPVFSTQNPILLAFGWGVIATWWVGLGLGVMLASCARLGHWPRLGLRSVSSRILGLIAWMAGTAILSGSAGSILMASGMNVIGFWTSEIPAGRHVPFAAAVWAHSASYLVGILGGLLVCWRTASERQNRSYDYSSSSMSQ